MKISLVIPTKNRLSTLKHCVESCLATDFNDCEIVISNNQSEDGTAEYLAGLSDDRLKILTTSSPISMRANFEYALDQTTGDYVFYIGDDDGVTRFGFEALAYLIRDSGADAINWTPLPYVWPDTYFPGALSSLVIKSQNFSKAYRQIDPHAVLERFADGSVSNYMEGAKIYHGCVSRKLVNRVREKANGQYFGAMCPDVFVAIANLKFLDKFISTNCAISISGKSSNSNGWANIKATGNRKRAELFFKDAEFSAIPDPRSIVDLKIRSLKPHELDALILVNEQVFDNSMDINYRNWVELIANNLNCKDATEYLENTLKIKKLARELGVGSVDIPDFTPHNEASGTSTDILKNRLKHTRCHSEKLSTVAAAAEAVDFPSHKIINGNRITNMLNWWSFQRELNSKM